MKKIVVLIFFMSLFMLFSCNKSKEEYDLITPEGVIKSYSLAINNNDEDIIEKITNYIDFKDNATNIEYLDVYEIKLNEEQTSYEKKNYMINNNEIYEIVVYDVNLKIKYENKDFKEFDGKYSKQFFLEKKDENSSWYIKSIGEG